MNPQDDQEDIESKLMTAYKAKCMAYTPQQLLNAYNLTRILLNSK